MRLALPAKDIQRAYAQSPIAVVEGSSASWYRICKYAGLQFPSDYGAFYCEVKSKILPPEFIFINQKLANYKKIAVLRHELGHYQCFISSCFCMSDKGIKSGECEAHAILDALKHFVDHNEQSPLLYSMEIVIRCLFADEAQRNAAVSVLRNPLWQDCCDLAGPTFDKWISNHPIVIERMDFLQVA